MTPTQLLRGQITDDVLEAAPIEVVDDVNNTYAAERHWLWL
jgi:hypothetical protein